jgi:hypothetical protein
MLDRIERFHLFAASVQTPVLQLLKSLDSVKFSAS